MPALVTVDSGVPRRRVHALGNLDILRARSARRNERRNRCCYTTVETHVEHEIVHLELLELAQLP